MCRFTLYLGEPLRLASLLTEPENSVVNQSFDAEEGAFPFNGDGFGVAWYVPELSPDPARFRSLRPAWSNQNLGHLARVLESGCVLAHVRAATPGLLVSEENCHPFVARGLAFMHNGGLAGFGALRQRIAAGLTPEVYREVLGTTDSEHLFGMFLDHHAAASGEGAERLLEAMARTLRDALAMAAEVAPGEASTLNLAVTDGESAVVTRVVGGAAAPARSLYVDSGGRYVCEEGGYRMVDPESHGATLISSEPLSADPTWQAVPSGHAVLARRGRAPEVRDLGIGSG